MELSAWTNELSQAIAKALAAIADQLGEDEAISVFSASCFPWHGMVELSILTASEAEADPETREAEAMAEWKYYAFSAESESWQQDVEELNAAMGDAYNEADEEQMDTLVAGYMNATAKAVAQPQVQTALQSMNLAPDFAIWVTHPDSGEHYYPPA